MSNWTQRHHNCAITNLQNLSNYFCLHGIQSRALRSGVLFGHPRFSERHKTIFTRRERNRHLFSDNGHNFVGANTELKILISMFKAIHSSKISSVRRTMGILYQNQIDQTSSQKGYWVIGEIVLPFKDSSS